MANYNNNNNPEISFICKRTVVSTKPVQQNKFFNLSVLDKLNEPNKSIRIVYYYRTPKGRKLGEATKKLRESISEILTWYPIVTGRFVTEDQNFRNNDNNDNDDNNSRDHKNRKQEDYVLGGRNWKVKCNDAGVRMVEARAKGSVENWLKFVDKVKELKLVHWEEMYYKPYFWSTFYVQLTEFEEGGLAIGVSCTHMLADPVSATVFIKAWANMTLSGKMVGPPLFHPLPPRRLGNMDPTHKPYTNLINHYKSVLERARSNSTNTSSTIKYVTIAMLFNDPMVQSCMSISRRHNCARPSPFEALSSLLWVSLSNIKGLREKEGLIDMSICLDLRKNLGADKGYFGNCMVYNNVPFQSKCLKEEEKLSNAVQAIREVAVRMDSEGVMDLIEWLEKPDTMSPTLMNGCDQLICVNLEHVDPYSASFEDGYEPIRISYHIEPVIGLGQALILPSPVVEGPFSRTVIVKVPQDEAIRLCEDDFIMRFTPTMLMGISQV